MEREISPPPTKRRRIETVSLHVGSDGKAIETDTRRLMCSSARCFRIFSWNINGVQPFLPPSTKPITSFFKPVAHQKKRAREDKQAEDGASHPPSQHPGNPFCSPLRAFLARHQWPEVLFLQELKINPTDEKTPTALLSTINTSSGDGDPVLPETTYTLDVNRPRDRFNAKAFGGKLYGVGTLLRSDFARRHVERIRHADWDLEGRVIIVELRRQPVATEREDHGSPSRELARRPKPLALVNVYAVNGTSAPYRSPETGKVAGTRHAHKLAFHSRLRDECLALEGRGFDVVVAGDLNIARGRLDGHPGLRAWPEQHGVNRADFNAKFFGDEDNKRADAYIGGQETSTGAGKSENGEGARFEGVDVFRALHGKTRKYTYHPYVEWGSSCDRVDLIIVSRSLSARGGEGGRYKYPGHATGTGDERPRPALGELEVG